MQARRDVASVRLGLAHLEAIAQAPPAVAYMSYQNGLGLLTARTESLIDKMLLTQLDNPAGLEAGLFKLETELLSTSSNAERYAAAAFKRTTDHARVEAQRILGVRIPADLMAQAGAQDSFVGRQVMLLQRATHDQVSALRRVILEGGTPADLEHKIWVIRNRGRLIARNEVWHLAESEIGRWAQLTGSSGFYYLTARDERVRITHAAHNGEFFYWDQPPSEMSEVNCRCRKVPAEAAVAGS